MTLVTAIQVLFAQTAPAGADFEGAFNALKGKKDTDLSQADATTLDELALSFQDFGDDPSGWLKKAPAADPRHSWWVKLAQALGASVTGGSAPATPTPSPGSAASPASSDPVVPEPEPEQGIDHDALAGGAPPPGRREGGGGGGGVVVRTDDVDDRPRRDKKKRRDRNEDEDVEEWDDDPRRKERKDRRDEAPRPLVPLLSRPDLAVREVPPQGLVVIQSERYKKMCTRIVECTESIRSGKTADLWVLRAEVLSMSRSPDAQIESEGIHLEGLIRALQEGVDLRRPHYFKAVYETGGTYDD